jgi:ABC-type antimicrobial peptide transport system permease subunit
LIAAGVALLLGLVGIYGVIAYIATQRTREIGIRIALGAQSGDVRWLFLRHGVLLMSAGIAIGIAASLAGTRVMSALMFGVSPIDPPTCAAVSVGLAGSLYWQRGFRPTAHRESIRLPRCDPTGELRIAVRIALELPGSTVLGTDRTWD